MQYESARRFIYQNARPLDLARWKYHFENGGKEDVFTALTAYQNADGGFGSALEPDCWNPNSAPVQTWVAMELLKELDVADSAHPIVQGILRYLSGAQDFDGHTWANVVPSNNAYPHAPWWHYEPGPALTYNPTASLIGFLLKFADKDSPLYRTACALAREAYDYFKAHFPLDAMHVVANFVELYEYLKESDAPELIDMTEFSALLHRQIQAVLTMDTAKWRTEYVCKPSLFIRSKASEFYLPNEAICDYECRFIEDTQEPDGTWNITWAWPDYPAEWSVSKNWWKSDLILKNLCFLRAIRG